MRRLCIIVLSLAAAFAPGAARADEPPAVIGFENPESAAWDAGTSGWYVSSKGGLTGDLVNRNGNGFISRVSRDGAVEKFVGGLNSPFGVAVAADTLYAADIDRLDVISISERRLVQTIAIPGSGGGLNDVAVDHATGDVYLSASAQNRIFRVVTGEEPTVEVFVEGDALELPNGLLVEDETLLVATLGIAQGGGRLLKIDLATKQTTIASQRIGTLDGVVRHGDDYLVTDFINGRLMRVAPNGSASLVAPLPPSAADLGIDPVREVVAVPLTFEHAAVFLPL